MLIAVLLTNLNSFQGNMLRKNSLNEEQTIYFQLLYLFLTSLNESKQTILKK